MACRTVQRPIIVSGSGIMVRANRIAGTEALSFQGGLEEPNEAPRHLDETTQRSLIAGSGRVDQYSALGRLPRKARRHVKALLQRAGRIPAVERDLAHQGMRETMCQNVLGPASLPATILAHLFAAGALLVDPGSCPGLQLSRALQQAGL